MASNPTPDQPVPPSPPPPDAPSADAAAGHWWDSLIVPGTLVIGLGLFLIFVFTYIWMLPVNERFTVEGTRLILVLTLIVSMLGFGGLMIARALFGTGDVDDLNTRYRLAREVFLVFAGTFGTVTGFYFGSAGSNASPVAALAVKPSYAAGKVVASIEGGTAPFIALLTPSGQAAGVSATSSDRTISFAADPCPDKARVTVVDGHGQQQEAMLDCAAAAPAVAPETSNEAAPVPSNAADDAATGGNAN